MNDLSAEALAGKRPWSTVLDETQKKVVAYAQQQGFKVSE
jgi:multiple sugar transport system substrate-binding protein